MRGVALSLAALGMGLSREAAAHTFTAPVTLAATTANAQVLAHGAVITGLAAKATLIVALVAAAAGVVIGIGALAEKHQPAPMVAAAPMVAEPPPAAESPAETEPAPKSVNIADLLSQLRDLTLRHQPMSAESIDALWSQPDASIRVMVCSAIVDLDVSAAERKRVIARAFADDNSDVVRAACESAQSAPEAGLDLVDKLQELVPTEPFAQRALTALHVGTRNTMVRLAAVPESIKAHADLERVDGLEILWCDGVSADERAEYAPFIASAYREMAACLGPWEQDSPLSLVMVKKQSEAGRHFLGDLKPPHLPCLYLFEERLAVCAIEAGSGSARWVLADAAAYAVSGYDSQYLNDGAMVPRWLCDGLRLNQVGWYSREWTDGRKIEARTLRALQWLVASGKCSARLPQSLTRKISPDAPAPSISWLFSATDAEYHAVDPDDPSNGSALELGKCWSHVVVEYLAEKKWLTPFCKKLHWGLRNYRSRQARFWAMSTIAHKALREATGGRPIAEIESDLIEWMEQRGFTEPPAPLSEVLAPKAVGGHGGL
jgi:hypothetical protein